MDKEDRLFWQIIVAAGVISGLAVNVGVQGMWIFAAVAITSFMGAVVYWLMSERRYSLLEAWFIMYIFSIVPMAVIAIIPKVLLGEW